VAKERPGSFLGGKIHWESGKDSEEKIRSWKARTRYMGDGEAREAREWSNRLPICPYGCDQEGQLQEIIVTPGKGAVGLYKDSEGLVFTAPMKMRPKPSTKAIQIGPDGEPMMVDDTT
jgi:hypothetical protein